MTKHKTASLYFHPVAIFSSPSSLILKTSFRFRRDSIFELKVPKGLLKPQQKIESLHSSKSKVASMPFVFPTQNSNR